MANIAKQPVDEAGNLVGLSVNTGKKSVEELASYPPVPGYGKISFTTQEEIVEAGGKIIPKPRLDNPFHAQISGIKPQDLINLMTEFTNPARQ